MADRPLNPGTDRPPLDVEEIFSRALELSPDDRGPFLISTCGNHEELRAEVEALLAAHEEAEDGALLCTEEVQHIGGVAAREAAELVAEKHRLATSDEEQPGEWIGRYRLLERIGEGGFGAVWMAEQREPVRRRVALKIVKLGMDTKQVVARFEQERQALALMDHPHIARVFDAGATEEGRPYFVMELVRGIKITDYCDKARLSTKERIRLFLTVCDAVQHAHQKGIIHRDLKPSNVLVTLHDGVPVPKVIDFGVAKAIRQDPLTELTLFTHFQEMIGTPLYMSPEQAEMSGLDVDTRSDVYSLGVLLYELMAGRTPIDPDSLAQAGEAEIRRLIRESEPPRPSTLLGTLAAEARTTAARNRGIKVETYFRNLRGDLDWIVIKALERDRNRRYESAHLLAADLRRHLSSEPVTARPPSTWYRFRQMVRRNKVTTATTAAVTLILIASLLVSVTQAARAERQADRANESLATLRATAPAFEMQARAVFADGDLAGAIEQLEYASKLQPEVPRYPLAKADLLMAKFRFAEAAEAYRTTLELDPASSRAKANVPLCETLEAEIHDGRELARKSIIKLNAHMATERRPDSEMSRIRKAIEPFVRDILLEMAGGDEERVEELGGTWKLNLNDLKEVNDLSPLRGLPISDIRLRDTFVTDLSPLAGMPLTIVDIRRTKVEDLSPLVHSPLRQLYLPTGFRGDVGILNQFTSLEFLWIRDPPDLTSLHAHPSLRIITSNIGDARALGQHAVHFFAGQLVAKGSISEAATLFRENLPDNSSRRWLALKGLGAIVCSTAEQSEYEEYCRDMLKRYKANPKYRTHDGAIISIANLCLQRPDRGAPDDEISALILAAEELRIDHPFRYYLTLVQGLFHLRTDKPAVALAILSQVPDSAEFENWGAIAAVRAMAHMRLGNPRQAQTELAATQDEFDRYWPLNAETPWRWHRYMLMNQLRREAEGMIAEYMRSSGEHAELERD